MVAFKAAEVDRFVARPDPALPIVLVFGPDAGLVRERAEALIRRSVDDPNDPFALARLDGDDLASEPTRLIEEANTIPLFGGRRAVWVQSRRPQFRTCGRDAHGVAFAGLPGRDRGRRSQAQCAAACTLRAGQECRRAALLSRCRA